MMRKLLFIAALMVSTVSFAQHANIGLVGGSTVTGWDSDTDMVTTDGVNYTLDNVVITVPANDPGVKFRQDNGWDINWGGSGFPSGTASLNGANIPAVNGTYNVTFNLTTLQYSFISTAFDVITLTGLTAPITMQTVDGVNYFYNNYNFENDAAIKFTLGSSNWGGTAFPSGTATAGGANIPVQAGAYNIRFNKTTLAYSFDYVTVNIIGNAAVNWDTDVAMSTTDGENYTLTNYTFTDGEIKFRINNNYEMNWGGTEFPAGTGVSNSADNIPVAAGDYDIAFNRVTGVYSFNPPTVNGIKDFSAKAISVYPNPAQNSWNFTAATVINAIAVIDVTGKVVIAANYNNTNAVVNAAGLTAGVYFARISTNNAVQVIKVVKK